MGELYFIEGGIGPGNFQMYHKLLNIRNILTEIHRNDIKRLIILNLSAH